MLRVRDIGRTGPSPSAYGEKTSQILIDSRAIWECYIPQLVASESVLSSFEELEAVYQMWSFTYSLS